MQENLDTRQELTAYFQSLPAEEVKKTVLDLIADSELGQLGIFINGLTGKLRVEEKPELSPAEKAQAVREWAESHRRDLTPLSDEAISRESIYSNERL